MTISRRFIITELKRRNIDPGIGYKAYATEVFNFLVEAFNIDREVLQDDEESLKYLEKTSNFISKNIREFMKGGGKKIKLDAILGPSSSHKVCTLFIRKFTSQSWEFFG